MIFAAGTPTAVLLTEAEQYPMRMGTLTSSLTRSWNRYADSDMSYSWLVKDVFNRNIGLRVQPILQTREVHPPGPLRWSHVCPCHRLWLLMALPSILTCMSWLRRWLRRWRMVNTFLVIFSGHKDDVSQEGGPLRDCLTHIWLSHGKRRALLGCLMFPKCSH